MGIPAEGMESSGNDITLFENLRVLIGLGLLVTVNGTLERGVHAEFLDSGFLDESNGGGTEWRATGILVDDGEGFLAGNIGDFKRRLTRIDGSEKATVTADDGEVRRDEGIQSGAAGEGKIFCVKA